MEEHRLLPVTVESRREQSRDERKGRDEKKIREKSHWYRTEEGRHDITL